MLGFFSLVALTFAAVIENIVQNIAITHIGVPTV
jgi:hypothetical protein